MPWEISGRVYSLVFRIITQSYTFVVDVHLKIIGGPTFPYLERLYAKVRRNYA